MHDLVNVMRARMTQIHKIKTLTLHALAFNCVHVVGCTLMQASKHGLANSNRNHFNVIEIQEIAIT